MFISKACKIEQANSIFSPQSLSRSVVSAPALSHLCFLLAHYLKSGVTVARGFEIVVALSSSQHASQSELDPFVAHRSS